MLCSSLYLALHQIEAIIKHMKWTAVSSAKESVSTLDKPIHMYGYGLIKNKNNYFLAINDLSGKHYILSTIIYQIYLIHSNICASGKHICYYPCVSKVFYFLNFFACVLVVKLQA